MTTIKEIQEQVHALAVEKGWWPSTRFDENGALLPDAFGAAIALVHSEITEAVRAVEQAAARLDDSLCCEWKRDIDGKPEGVPSEVADVVIRVLDLFGASGVPAIQEPSGFDVNVAEYQDEPEELQHRLRKLHDYADDALEEYRNHGNVALALEALVTDCFIVSFEYEFYLFEAIERKHAFNKTRPVRHGGKAL